MADQRLSAAGQSDELSVDELDEVCDGEETLVLNRINGRDRGTPGK